MCCFSPRVDAVSSTNIFARSSVDGRQFLVYAMTLSSKEDVAMILPLPVPANSPEDALKWISLKEYPDFFRDLHRGFPPSPAAPPPGTKSDVPKPRALAVVEVGDFEASFVPSEKDFERLDERFRLPSTPPAAKGFGFAVFKLKKGSRKIHPMAFEFPRANPARLFFPTLHIHDGKVHETADFDHALFAQNREGERLEIQDWQESPEPASLFVKTAKAQGLVDGERHLYLREILGNRKNEDVVI
jgi:hypothetical protein